MTADPSTHPCSHFPFPHPPGVLRAVGCVDQKLLAQCLPSPAQDVPGPCPQQSLDPFPLPQRRDSASHPHLPYPVTVRPYRREQGLPSPPSGSCGLWADLYIYLQERERCEGLHYGQGPTSRGSCPVGTSLKPLSLLQPVWG